MAYSPFPVPLPEESVFQRAIVGSKKPEHPPPLICKSCGLTNRRYSTKENGKGKRYYNLVCSACRGSERRRQIRLLNDPISTAKLKEQDRRHRLKRKFGLTVEGYDRILKSQGGVCDICKKPNNRKTYMPVDHDHQTGNVRGILCERCNKAIGLLDEIDDNFENAIKYLRKHR